VGLLEFGLEQFNFLLYSSLLIAEGFVVNLQLLFVREEEERLPNWINRNQYWRWFTPSSDNWSVKSSVVQLIVI